MASMKNQMTNAMKEINEIGNSKRECREKGDFSNIHSTKYFKEALGTSVRFGEFCKDKLEVRSVFDITKEHRQTYLNHIKENGSTKGNLINIESHLLKLQIAVQKFAVKLNKSCIPFIEKRSISPKEREKPIDRSYNHQELDGIIKNISAKALPALEMSRNLGLRMKEVCNIRVEHVVKREDGKLEILIENGKGVTKGGRFRAIPVPKEYENKLAQLIRDKPQKAKILNVKESSLRSALKRACAKAKIKTRGWHGFRHTYARNRLNELLGSKKIEGQRLIRRMVNNLKAGKRMDASVIKQERELYKLVKQKINQVHSELGHGQNRWKLVEVYMS